MQAALEAQPDKPSRAPEHCSVQRTGHELGTQRNDAAPNNAPRHAAPTSSDEMPELPAEHAPIGLAQVGALPSRSERSSGQHALVNGDALSNDDALSNATALGASTHNSPGGSGCPLSARDLCSAERAQQHGTNSGPPGSLMAQLAHSSLQRLLQLRVPAAFSS